MVMPPMSAAALAPPAAAPEEPPRCPATAISAIPTSGTVMFARMLGTARDNMSLWEAFISLLEMPDQVGHDGKRGVLHDEKRGVGHDGGHDGYLNFLSSSSMPR